MNSFCLYFDSRRIHELDFLLQRLACAWLTPRWFIEALRCIYDLVHSEFPISALPCCTDLIMISARVIGLRSLESNVFYNSCPRGKMQKFSQSAAFSIYTYKERKISGAAWTLLDTEGHRLIMATRRKISRLSLRLTRGLFFFFYDHTFGPGAGPMM